MPRVNEEPLTKITLNLFSPDVEPLKQIAPQGYTEKIREIVREWLEEYLHDCNRQSNQTTRRRRRGLSQTRRQHRRSHRLAPQGPRELRSRDQAQEGFRRAFDQREGLIG